MAADLSRIRNMENCLEECSEVTEQLAIRLDQMKDLREKMIRLFEYYGSEEWHLDRDAELPDGFPAGVLTEDLIYNLIMDVKESAIQMLELATDILKNRL